MNVREQFFILSSVFLLISACSSTPRSLTTAEQKFFFSVGQGDESYVVSELQKGFNPNLRNPSGTTPLMLAAFRGRVSLADQLIRNGAQLEIREAQERTALFYAVEGGNSEMVQKLLEAGANPNVKDKFNLTPLMVAAHKGQAFNVRLLIERGADVGAMDENRWNALFFAVAGGSIETMSEIFKKDQKINHQDADGSSLGHICAEKDYVQMLQALEKRGLDLSLKDRQGRTLKDTANQNMNFKMIDYLETK